MEHQPRSSRKETCGPGGSSNLVERRKVLYEGNSKRAAAAPRKPGHQCIVPSLTFAPRLASSGTTTAAESRKVRCAAAAAFYDGFMENGQLTGNGQRSSLRCSSEGSWTDIHLRSPLSSETESSSSEQNFDSSNEKAGDLHGKTITLQKTSFFGQEFLHATAMEELKRNNVFRGTSARMSKNVNDLNSGAISKIKRSRLKSDKQNSEVDSTPLPADDSVVASSRPKSDAYGRTNSFCRTSVESPAMSLFYGSLADIVYDTGCPEEDQRLKKLHYAAIEIYTVERKFVEQLELIAVEYPAFLAKCGKEWGVDLLKPSLNGHPHLISQIALQLLMVKEAHKVLLEKFSSKIIKWDSKNPNMAECLKNGAGFLKYCLPYLKEKKKHVGDFIRLLQDNDELARATAKFEEQVMGKISVIQQLDIVHQNVVRYTILLEAYKKHLLPASKELEVCKEALTELSKVSELVDRQISLAEMEKRLIDLYRRLEGRFNVFEANRHLLFEGELMKQSRKDLQPRYLILFSDVLLICKYSRTPSLGTDANFHSEFYKFLVSRIRVKAEEHGEYETHFQLYTTQKSAVFIAKTKRERNEWVKRISEAKMEAKQLRRFKALRNKDTIVRVPHRGTRVVDVLMRTSKNELDHSFSPNNVSTTGKYKYTPLWIPDPKATSCMMAGCSTRFSVLNRRHHCRECGCLICRSCVGYAPVKTNSYFVRTKVCPECYVKISKKWNGELGAAIFTAPENEFLTKTNVPNRNAEGVVSGTVFVRNQKGGENEKWGRLTSDGVLVLCFYDAEFDSDPVARHVLFGFTLCVQELDDGGRLFELRHANQVNNRNAISVHFRVAHSGNAERWYKALEEGLRNGGTISSNL